MEQGENSCFADCVKKRECWHAFGHSGMDVVQTGQTGYDDSNCFTLFVLSLNDRQVQLSVRKQKLLHHLKIFN